MADFGAEVVAETERLVLRREQPGDLDVWLEHMNTPEVMARVGGVQPPEKIAEAFVKMADGAAESGPSFHYVALKSDGTLIGKCGLSRIDTAVAPDALRNEIQVGWTLRADFWGQGYAREAAEAALGLAFDRFGLARVYGQTSESNVPSWRLMERLGMRRCAELDYADADYPPEDNPTMIYRLDAAEWQARAAAGARQAHG